MTLDFILRAAARSLDQGKRKPHCGDGGIRRAMQEVEHIEWCAKYGEPSYEDPRKGIVFANWNVFPTELGDILERAGYSIEWSDEWTISYETNRAYRTSPDSHDWKRSYVLTDGGDVIGRDEIENGDMLDWYLDEYLANNPHRADTFDLDLTQHGFARFNGDYETGFHPGQNDKPQDVLKHIKAAHPEHDVVFALDTIGQFDARWSAWIKPKEQADGL